VEQHHFERSEKHHIAAGDASIFFDFFPNTLTALLHYDIIQLIYFI
jgi:hypothetical protein